MSTADHNRELDLARQLLEELRTQRVSWSTSGQQFEAWRNKVINLIQRVYGNESPKEKRFRGQTFFSAPRSYLGPDPTYDSRLHEEFVHMLPRAMAYMEALVQDLELRAPSAPGEEQATRQRPKVFISHGGETTLRNQLELFLWRHGYRPIIVEAMPSLGLGLDAKVDHYLKQSDFAVVLAEATGSSVQDGELQPRGNVIDELARIREALGNKFTVLLEAGVTLPSIERGAITWQQADPDSFSKALMALADELTAQGVTGIQE